MPHRCRAFLNGFRVMCVRLGCRSGFPCMFFLQVLDPVTYDRAAAAQHDIMFAIVPAV